MGSLLPLVFLAACVAPITPDARYIGSITPATPNDRCKTGRAVLRLQAGEVLFIPDETTWVLTGTATATGALQAERVGRGASKQPFPTRLSGTWTPETASGTYTTPGCTYAVQLTRR